MRHLDILDCESLVRAVGHFYDSFMNDVAHNIRNKTDIMTLWMGVMMNVDDRFLSHAQRQLVELANWNTASTAAASV